MTLEEALEIIIERAQFWLSDVVIDGECEEALKKVKAAMNLGLYT